MDQHLEKKWRSTEPPFSFDCLHPEDLLQVSQLRTALLLIVARLRESYPDASMVEVEDWHNHDGYIMAGEPSCWEALERSLQSDETLYAGRHNDDYVRRAFYPANDAFLLRFDLLDEDDDDLYPGIWGDFDLCAEEPVLAELRTRLYKDLARELVLEPAKAYFDRGYAG